MFPRCFARSASQAERLSSPTEERTQNDPFHLRAGTQRRFREAERKARKKTKEVALLRVFLYSTTLQAADITNIFVELLQRRPLSRLGVFMVLVAVRHQKGLQVQKDEQNVVLMYR